MLPSSKVPYSLHFHSNPTTSTSPQPCPEGILNIFSRHHEAMVEEKLLITVRSAAILGIKETLAAHHPRWMWEMLTVSLAKVSSLDHIQMLSDARTHTCTQVRSHTNVANKQHRWARSYLSNPWVPDARRQVTCWAHTSAVHRHTNMQKHKHLSHLLVSGVYQ